MYVQHTFARNILRPRSYYCRYLIPIVTREREEYFGIALAI